MSNVIYTTRVIDVAYGSLVVYDPLVGKTATVHLLDGSGNPVYAYYAEVKRYHDAEGRAVYAAVFPTLPVGTYRLHEPGYPSLGEKWVTVFPGATAEVRYT